ncbi:MAG: flagellar biosynthesis protein FlhF [Pseudomonas sp.]|nr:flagellar biosynthesis protein FlhF [Pseudomonas sp.]
MSVQRFVGANSREAMHQVRLALGEDALILSSQSIAEGVEILALVEDAPAAISPRHAVAAYTSQAPEPAAPARPAAIGNDFAALSQLLLGEMQQMRTLLGRRHEAPPPSDPTAPLLADLLGAGFSHCLAQELTEPLRQLPPGDSDSHRASLLQQMAARLPVLSEETRLLEEGGVIALVGPTGVGKTTTTAKLAARYVMRHGAAGLALVTTDSFRIGAHEQLRIYARLLGGEVHALGHEESLEGLLTQLADKRLVIIDTVGMSQRDQRLLTQVQQLGRIGRPLRLMLVLNAASHGDTLEEVVDTYCRAALAAGSPLRDCIVSKCDEAPRLGPALDVLMRHGLRLNYLSTGQQVPEDLHLPDVPSLLQQALAAGKPSMYAAAVAPLAGKGGQRLDALGRSLLAQGRLLETARDTLRRHLADFALLDGAWHLAGLPASLQGQALHELIASTPCVAGPGQQMVWGSERPVVGATWKMPLLSFDGAGRLQLRPWLAHQLPIGLQQRLDWSAEHRQAQRHLWVGCPNRDALQRLGQAATPWLATANRSQRVLHAGASATLAQLAASATFHAIAPLRQRGRWVRMEQGYLPVALPGAPEQPLRAWFGTLREADSDHCLGLRYWLGDSLEQGEAARVSQASSLCQLQTCEALPALTLRAWNILGERQGALQAELRVFLAAALAAAACRLDQDLEGWANKARTQLLELIGKRRAHSPVLLLDALMQLLTASDTLQRMAPARALA